MLENNEYFINSVLKKHLLPIVLVLLETTIMAFYNSMIVGRVLGSSALAIMNLASSYTFFYFMLGCLINIGGSVVASVALGKGDTKLVGQYEFYSFIMSIIMPVLISVFFLVFLQSAMDFFGADEALAREASLYIRIVLIFGFGSTLMYFPFNFLRLDGRSNVAFGVFGFMLALDVVTVYLVLHAGLGIEAVGLASSLSVLVADCIGCLFLFFGRGTQIHPERFGFKETAAMSLNILKAGSSSALNNFCNMLRTAFMNAIIFKAFQTPGLASFAVGCAVINLTSATTAGVGQTASPLIGMFYGERDNAAINTVQKSAGRYSIKIHVLMTAFFIVMAGPLASGFGIEPDNMEATKAVIRIIALSLCTCGMINIYIYAFNATKRMIMANLLTFLRSFALVVPIASLLAGSGLNIGYTLSCFVIADIITIGVMFLITAVYKKYDKNLKGRLLLDGRVEESEVLSFSVQGTGEGAVDAASKVEAFCEEKGVSPKLTMMLPLAIEELLVVVAEHCLSNNPSKYSDVRILKNGDDLVIRIRCDGNRFDPIQWYEEQRENLSADDLLVDSSLGIKMIKDISKEISFRWTFGYNNLIVVM
ncbi:MAG: ATP-binding protein [Lachnospiraceae bacterium]|nr:ATP-binding protein [Lachnospiraceae bacterium]